MVVTLFECWNGGMVQWDGRSQPQFVFAFPDVDPEMLRFFQLSGRVCEVLTRTEWYIQAAGQVFDIPNLPEAEIDYLVRRIQQEVGYAPVAVPYQLGNPFSGYVTLPLVLWVNGRTGRADMYSPATGLVPGQQLSHPQQPAGGQAPYAPAGGFQGGMQQPGAYDSAAGRNLYQSLAGMAGDSRAIDDFLASGDTGVDYGGSAWSGHDASTQFEEDSAGWPGGAYENPDSGWYTPDYTDDY